MEDRAPVSGTGRGKDYVADKADRGGEGDTHMFEDLIDQLAESDHARPDEKAIRDFSEACKRADTDPRERQRIRDIADLVDADGLIYGQALAAVDRGDRDAALPLLRRCANTGIGESAWLLATVLEDLGKPEATMWYLRAAREGDSRAEDKLAELRTRPAPAPSTPGDNPRASLIVLAEGTIEKRTLIDALAPLVTSLELSGPGLGPVPLSLSVALLAADLCRRADTTASWGTIIRRLAAPDRAHLIDIEVCLAGRYRTDWTAAAVRNAFMHSPAYRVGRDLTPLPVPVDYAPGDEAPVMFCIDHAWLSDFACGPADRRRWRAGTARIALLDTGRPWHLTAREETAADVMLPPEAINTITPGTTVHDALEQMVYSGVRALPVHDSAGVVGVITLADIAGHLHRARVLQSIQRVETLMQPPTEIPAGMPLSEVMTAAASDTTGLLIITGEDGMPAGYLTHEALLARAPSAGEGGNSQPATRSGLMLPAEAGLLKALTR
jgi:CBS domain-containing protein